MLKAKPLYTGSIIGLKPEFREQYTALHRNTFPGVLDRIRKSAVTDYSIFLSGDILFSHMVYEGEDYGRDMAAMAEDAVTRDWWKLTDPMQLPLDDRKSGEWWATMDTLFAYRQENRNGCPERLAFYITIPDGWPNSAGIFSDLENQIPASVSSFCIYRKGPRVFLFLATCKRSEADDFLSSVSLSSGLINPPEAMEEVFHTHNPGVPDPSGSKKVFVTGCFDMLHSGHIAFLEEASSYGKLYVGIGSDVNVENLKGRLPVNPQNERKYMLDALSCVNECRVNTGWGIMDFVNELREIRPDLFIVNEDGHTPAKHKLCEDLGIEYKILRRIPHSNLPARSTTALRTECTIPFRIDLAGGWLDQPFVSSHFPGPVLTISIEPVINFNERSGMASSTRRKAIELWRTDLPHGDPEQLARILFSYENPPGTKEVAGSQDSLGIVLPGLNKLNYEGDYWPVSIQPVHDEDILTWIEEHLFLVTLGPRVNSYNVLDNTSIDRQKAQTLAIAALDCWEAITAKDIVRFGDAFRRSFEAQLDMFPNMADDGIMQTIKEYRNQSLGWKLSGAGGGGYLILVAEQAVDGAMQIRIRRKGGL